MAESRFIKTVTFGGFDRADVIKRMEFLNSQIYDLRNELRETKLLMEDIKKGTPEEKAHENVMSVERAKLTEFQVKNETLNTKVKTMTEEAKNKDAEIAELKAKVDELTAELKEKSDKIQAYEAGSDPMAISQVFVQAQVSSNQLTENAKADAEKIKNDANAAVEEIITDANNSAAQIIYEAERDAAEKIAEARNKSEQMDTASNNLRALILEDVGRFAEKITAIKSAVDEFASKGGEIIGKSEKVLGETKAALEEGGVPEFKIPEHFEAELPEPPIVKKTKRSSENEERKKELLSGLDSLDEFTSALNAGDQGGKPSSKPAKSDKKPASLDMNELDELLKQSEMI